jgi:hypothetical protein
VEFFLRGEITSPMRRWWDHPDEMIGRGASTRILRNDEVFSCWSAVLKIDTSQHF